MQKAYRLYTSLYSSIAKFTLKVPLTFLEVQKTNHENFDFVCLSFFFFVIMHNSKTTVLLGIAEENTCSLIALVFYSTCKCHVNSTCAMYAL